MQNRETERACSYIEIKYQSRKISFSLLLPLSPSPSPSRFLPQISLSLPGSYSLSPPPRWCPNQHPTQPAIPPCLQKTRRIRLVQSVVFLVAYELSHPAGRWSLVAGRWSVTSPLSWTMYMHTSTHAHKHTTTDTDIHIVTRRYM